MSFNPLDIAQLTTMTTNNIDEINKANNQLTSLENNKSNKDHKHKIADITDYNEYDDSGLRALINSKMPVFQYSTFDDIKNNWSSIQAPAIIFADEGPENFASTMVIKQKDQRSLCIATNKD